MRLYLQCYAAHAILISRLRLYVTMLCCSHYLDISTETVFSLLCCLHHRDILTQTVLCNAMLLIRSWYLDLDYILICYAAYVILITRLIVYFQCYAAYAFLISRLRLYFNAMLLTPCRYLDRDCIMQCYDADDIILISQLRLYFYCYAAYAILYPDWDYIFNAMLLTPSWYLDWDCFCAVLCCFYQLDISTETVICNSMLLIHLDISTQTILCYAMLTQSWYLDWDCILQCYAAYTILLNWLRLYFAMLYWTHNLDISIKTVFCNAMLLTPSWYLDWECICNDFLLTPTWCLDCDCILQCYAVYNILISQLRLYFAMLCCLHHLNSSTETVFCNAMLPTPSK